MHGLSCRSGGFGHQVVTTGLLVQVDWAMKSASERYLSANCAAVQNLGVFRSGKDIFLR